MRPNTPSSRPGDASFRPSPTRDLLIAGVAIIAIWILAMARWVQADAVVPWDSKNQFYAFFRFLAASIHAGASPFWNPFHYGGHPAVADPQSLIFNPPFVLWAWFDPEPSLRSFDLLVHAHLLAGGLAIAVIGARERWPAPASVLAAVVFMFGAGAAGRLQHTGIILGYGLLPLALLLLQVALDRRSILAALGFAAVAAMVALGRNQVSLLLCFMMVAAALAQIATASEPWRLLRSRTGVLATMAVAGFALLAVPLLLTLQFAALSNRADLSLDDALLGSLHPANLAQLFVADVFGAHSGGYWGPGIATEPAVAYTDDSFNYLFVGAAPILLMLWLGLGAGRAFRRGRIFLTTVAGLALVFALGRYTPLFAFAFEWLPGVHLFRRPVDASFLVLLALALLCGHLLADYVRDGLPRLRPTAAVIVVAVPLAALALAVIFSARQGHAGDALRTIATTLLVSAAIVLALVLGRTRHRLAAAALVAAIGAAELLWWNTAFRLNAEPRANYAVLERPVGADAAVLDRLDGLLREEHQAGRRPRVEVLGLGGAWQNVAMVRGLEAINGYNPLRIGRYERRVAPGEANWDREMREFPPSFDGYDSDLARTLGLEFLLLGAPIEAVKGRPPAAALIQAGPPVWLYRLPHPTPRVTFLRHVEITDTDALDAAGRLVTPLAPDRVLIASDTPPRQTYADPPGTTAGEAHITAWRPDRVEIDVSSERGGMLTLHDSWYPGWIAEIDGTPAPILRADILFRAVEMPPGRHRLTFRFAPLSMDNLVAALRAALCQAGKR